MHFRPRIVPASVLPGLPGNPWENRRNSIPDKPLRALGPTVEPGGTSALPPSTHMTPDTPILDCRRPAPVSTMLSRFHATFRFLHAPVFVRSRNSFGIQPIFGFAGLRGEGACANNAGHSKTSSPSSQGSPRALCRRAFSRICKRNIYILFFIASDRAHCP